MKKEKKVMGSFEEAYDACVLPNWSTDHPILEGVTFQVHGGRKYNPLYLCERASAKDEMEAIRQGFLGRAHRDFVQGAVGITLYSSHFLPPKPNDTKKPESVKTQV